MWVFFGIAAIVFAVLNIVWAIRRREAKWFRFISMSLTALTVCAEYSLIKKWVMHEDWGALMDVVPGMTGALWFLVAASIVINGVSLLLEPRR